MLMTNLLYLLPKMTEMRDGEPRAAQMVPLKCLNVVILKVLCHIWYRKYFVIFSIAGETSFLGGVYNRHLTVQALKNVKG